MLCPSQACLCIPAFLDGCRHVTGRTLFRPCCTHYIASQGAYCPAAGTYGCQCVYTESGLSFRLCLSCQVPPRSRLVQVRASLLDAVRWLFGQTCCGCCWALVVALRSQLCSLALAEPSKGFLLPKRGYRQNEPFHSFAIFKNSFFFNAGRVERVRLV